MSRKDHREALIEVSIKTDRHLPCELFSSNAMNQMFKRMRFAAARHIAAIIEGEGEHHAAAFAGTGGASPAALMLDAHDSLAEALVTFFEATSRGETAGRLRSEVYTAQALSARPHILSSWEIGRSLARHGFMKVRPRFSRVAIK